MKITKIDHIVLTVDDIDESVEFYTKVLGMEKEIFGDSRVALKFGSQKINLHSKDSDINPKALVPTAGSTDLCFITKEPIEKSMEYVSRCGVKIIEGAVDRVGANAKLRSFYFYDPDGNLIEIANEVSF